jgi:hypothetical protein
MCATRGIPVNVKFLITDPITKRWIVFYPDMPHLTKNIVTSLISAETLKNSKQDLRYGKVPIDLQMIEEVWLKCDGASDNFRAPNSLHGTLIKMPILR